MTDQIYRRSWVDRIQQIAEGFPLAPLGLYVVLAVVILFILHGSQWVSGNTEKFLFTLPLTWTAAWTPFMLAMIHILDRVARQSLTQFCPASGLEAEDYERVEYRLITMQSRPVILTQLAGTVIFLGTIWVAPTYSGLVNVNPISDAIVYLIFWFNIGMLLVSMYHHTRQLEMVSNLHQEAASIDIFDTAPIFAFSRLSFWAAVFTVFMILPSIFIYQITEENIIFAVPSIVGMGFATLVFFLPLYSLNKRLVNEKSAMLGQVRQRIRDTIHELNQDMDQGDLSHIETQHAQLALLVLEQEYLEKLRTWPWPHGTFARLLGLIALPVLLFILQLLIQRIFPP
ncbi:MAG: hypothetical protein JSV42_17225 [Chloroflexota bacterium]|nr:MAG: hypothetical protein JSV42_17225 [Chloroflexota bacterium]